MGIFSVSLKEFYCDISEVYFIKPLFECLRYTGRLCRKTGVLENATIHFFTSLTK